MSPANPLFLGSILILLALSFLTVGLRVPERKYLDSIYQASRGSWVYNCDVTEEYVGPESTYVIFTFDVPHCLTTARIQSVPNGIWRTQDKPYVHKCWSTCESICQCNVSIVRNLDERGYYAFYLLGLAALWFVFGITALTAILFVVFEY